MSKIKNHYHDEITNGSNDNHIPALLSKNTILNIKLLIHLAAINCDKGWCSFYLPPDKLKELKHLKNDLDRL